MTKKESILITGGAGNIGSSLVRALHMLEDYKLTVIDNLSTGDFSKIDEFKDYINFHNCDVNNLKEIEKVFTENKFSYVFHFAAVVGVRRTLQNPVNVLKDISGFFNIFDLSVKNNIKRIFYASSSEVYGEPIELPLKEEETPLNTQLPYAKVKSIGESFCKSYFKEFNLPFTIIRLFNTYGPNQSEDFVIAKFIDLALRDKNIEVYGDGNQTRTFCYVDDTVGAIVKMLQEEKAINEVINVGSDIEIQINDLAILIKKILSSNSEIINISALEEGDMTRRKPDNTKMIRILKKNLFHSKKELS